MAQRANSDITSLKQFYNLVGHTGSFVECKSKRRISNLYDDLEDAEYWLSLGNEYQIGWWVGEGYIVLDFDKKQDVNGVLKLLKHYKIKTLISKTTRGVHVYFKYDYTGSQRINGHLACGLRCDLKVTGKGYPVLPFNLKGRKFNQANEIAELPIWLTPLSMPASSESYIPAKAGKRNDSILKQGGRLKYHGFEGEDLRDILEASNLLLDEPLDDKELSVLTRSADSYETRNPETEGLLLRNEKGKVMGINHEAMATYIANNYDYFLYGKVVYWYHDGYYDSLDGELLLKEAIKGLIPIPELIKAKTINDIYSLCLIDINKQYNLFKDVHPNMIAFTNGTYDFNTGKLIAHNPKHLVTVKIPHECGGVHFNDSKLKELLKLMRLPKDDVVMLMDFMATLVVPRNYKCMMFLYGPTNTGKSIIGKYMARLVGATNTTSLSLDNISSRFYATQLRNRLLNWHGDSSSTDLKNISTLKMVTGGDEIIFELKGKDANTTFINFSKLVYSFNEMPLQREEKSDAFYQRLRILRIGVPQDLDNKWVQEVINSAPELLLWLCNRAHKLQEVSKSKQSIKYVKNLHYSSDNVMLWFNERVSSCSKEEMVSLIDLRRDYLIWCTKEDQFQQSDTAFGNTLNNLNCPRERVTIDGTRVRVVYGIKLKV